MPRTTTEKQIVKWFQIVAETTPGVTPASPNFGTLGVIPLEGLGTAKPKENDHQRQIGDEDVVSHVPGPNKYPVETDFLFNGIAYASRLVNAANHAAPAGTAAETLTGLYSRRKDGIEVYNITKGMIVAGGSIKGEIGKAHKGTINWTAMSRAVEAAAHGLTTPTFVTTKPAGPFWHWKDGGATPISVNAVNINARSIAVNINRGGDAFLGMSNKDPFDVQIFDREITFELENLLTTDAIETLFQNETEFPINWTLKAGAGILRLVDCLIDDWTPTKLVVGGKEVVVEKITGTAKTSSLAAT